MTLLLIWLVFGVVLTAYVIGRHHGWRGAEAEAKRALILRRAAGE